MPSRLVSGVLTVAALLALASSASAQTPVAGHYPPGQSGIGGAAAARVGWSYTNFNRIFSNIELTDANGYTVDDVDELRYANISMFTCATSWKVLGMRYGALVGIPFSTGNLTPSSDDVGSSSFGLGDVLVTPVSLYGVGSDYDVQFQFTVWTASGRFTPGGSDNRGSGFWSLVYSLGGVWYPGAERDDWSASAIARFEQNFEQRVSGIQPGDDVVVDWGIGKAMDAGSLPLDLGVSGFGTWQLSRQEGGTNDPGPYRYFGLGPEAALSASEWLSLRLRLHWEYGARNAIRGNDAWLIAHFTL